MTNTTPPNTKVRAFLDDIALINPERHQLISAIHALILGLDAGVSEEIKYGGILFSAGGSAKSAAQPFCGIFSYTAHVSVEFSHGAQLRDEFAVLEGAGKFRRHIKLTSEQDIERKQLPTYLAQAFAATPAN
ncbi:DUF1801 domain-containing protein [Chitinibacter sp. SCUT-21]|uniref:DUF1801 domain-containing protein n=1 Tax=Chitinibacter sp. SCUT-21 TaxID=2970891 RepID=UPI0035A60951